MAKIQVKVCMGTTCFVMGGSNLQELNDIIPQKYGDKVEVMAANCLGLCSINWEYSKAPYVKVNEEVVNEATVEKVLNIIDRKLGVNKGANIEKKQDTKPNINLVVK